MTVHKIALVGAGRMGSLHAMNAAASDRFELVAIADHNTALAEELAGRCGGSVVPYDAILGDPEIRGVIIASSTSSHLDNTAAAVAAGKAIFCEKPLSLDADTLASRLPTLEAAGQPIFVAFNRRFDPHLLALKQTVEAREAGDVETIHIINHDPAAPDPAFIPRSGGLFKDFTIHDFDTAAWLLNEPFVELFATGSCLVDAAIGELGDIDSAKLLLKTGKGQLCVISNSRRSGCGYDQRVEIFGSQGALAVDNVQTAQLRRLHETGTSGAAFPYSFAQRYAAAYQAELEHFADVIDGRAKPATGPRDSLRALRLADAAEQSLRADSPIQIASQESR